MNTKQSKLTDQLRHLINSAEISRYEIWKQTGIDQAVLSKFLVGKSGLSMDTLDKLGDILDLQITKRQPTPNPLRKRN